MDAGVPVELDAGDEEGELGIAHEVSQNGLTLFSRVELSVGELITLRFRPQGPEGELEEVSAKVLRTGPNDAESLWPIRSAVVFKEPVEVDLDLLEQQ